MARRTSSPTTFPATRSTLSDVSIRTDTTSTTDSSMTVRCSPSPPDSPENNSSSPRRRSITRLFGGVSSPLGAGQSNVMDPRPQAPMPLQVEREIPRVFDMGPRMSSNYKTLGIKAGGDLSAASGVPLNATISFESSGGTGALLVARDPVQRHLLRHRGILKAYFLAHREFIHDTYGQSEDLELDEMAFIYGQDCTSDWACAVTVESERGSKMEFEVFSLINAGVWGEWKTACTSSQRGPHRDASSQEPIRTCDQSIVIKRLTIQTRRFRSMKLHAFAEPKSDDNDEREGDEQVRNRLTSGDWHDPLALVHEYLLEMSDAAFSVASDDDVLTLLKRVGKWESHAELKVRLWQEARMHSTIQVDKEGVANLFFTTNHSAPKVRKGSLGSRQKLSVDLTRSTDGLAAF
ncbi:hypothetical protein CBS101457_001970 [Exobasidium rhododendri]|nr:hypothetical protein CBS101457_001970 [Exobasidium rhododendri]